MKNVNVALLGLALAAFVAVPMAAPPAQAAPLNQSIKFTIKAPVQLPGNRLLAPGTYWLKLADADMAPNVAAICNADQSKVIGYFLTRAVDRNTYSGVEFTLAELSRKAPDVLLSWFYPGTEIGHEFIYSPRIEKKLNRENAIKILAHPA